MSADSGLDRVDVTEGEWLWSLPTREGQVHRVDELLPSGYDAYLRLLHPFLPWGTQSRGDALQVARRTWRELADQGDAEGHLVVAWLARHGKGLLLDDIAPSVRFNNARKGGWAVPAWMEAPVAAEARLS